MNRPVLVTPPAVLPVSLDEAKAHLRIDHNDDDALITGLIGAAVAHLDGWTGVLGRCLVEQTWRQDFERLASCLSLPLGPVISISSVMAGDDTVDRTSYSLKTDAGGRSRVEFSGVLVSGPVSVTYKAGYATIPDVPAVPGEGEEPGTPAIPVQSTVPDALKIAIILHITMIYEALKPEERESYQRAFDALIAPYRRIGV